ncbi:hypothetical protein D3C78_1147360 [compost metagenome]
MAPAMVMTIKESPRATMDAALMVGSTVRRIIDQIIMGSVDSLPLTKTVIISSSNESANTKIAAPTMLGRRIGKVMR